MIASVVVAVLENYTRSFTAPYNGQLHLSKYPLYQVSILIRHALDIHKQHENGNYKIYKTRHYKIPSFADAPETMADRV